MRRTRSAFATLVLAALGSRFVAPVSADAGAPVTDPHLLAIAEKAGCAPTKTPAARQSAEPHYTLTYFGTGQPAQTRTVKLAYQASSAEPVPSATPSATPPPTPTPSATPSLIPIPPPPQFPGSLVPPTPFATPIPTPPPLPTPTASPTPGPMYLERFTAPPSIAPAGATAGPSAVPSATAAGATPTPVPSPLRTLAPNAVVAVADSLEGSTEPDQPGDLVGNVHIFYQEGQIVGDRAHFDGKHTVVITGHPYLINRIEDAILNADAISFDTLTRRATLENGRGETTEGVQVGKLHYSAQRLNANASGVSHGDRASFTTCENQRGGYHVEAKSIDIIPGNKLVAHNATLFLGALAVFYIPLLVIPLRDVKDPRRKTSFLPVVGYSESEGFWIKTTIAFAPSETYYGYYRVDYFTKEGLCLGYVAYIGTKTHRRFITVDAYTISNRQQGGRQSNINLQETENFSSRIRGQFGFNYTGDFGPNLTLPASENITASIVRLGDHGSQNLTFSRFMQGNLSDNLNVGFVDQTQIGPSLSQQLNVSYGEFDSQLSSTHTLHINTLTHYFSHFADYNLVYDKTNYSDEPFGYDRLPELQMLPHIAIPNLPWQPQVQFTIGDYTEPQNHFTAGRAEIFFSQPIFLRVFGSSDFSANYSIRQDLYTTGDEKAYDMQNASLSTPIGSHIVNSITYNEQHPIGPEDVPFQLLDRLAGGGHGAQDVLRFFNADLYSFSISTGTNFNRQAQPIQYQLTARPTFKTYFTIGGFYTPGPGQGFGTTNLQLITPFGYDTTLQFSTNFDWKNHGRLNDKNIYLSKIIGKCYDVQLAYNQDLKQFFFNIVILAFPGQGAGFGIGNQQTSILPQNFAF